MSQVRPLHDRVVIKRIAAAEKSKGGIIIPDAAKEKPVEGEVLAVGPGKLLRNGEIRPLAVKIGDRVFFGAYSGTEVKVLTEDRLIVREDDILSVVERGEHLRPTNDRLLVRRTKSDTKKGLIIIPDSAQERANEGIVVAAGPGMWSEWIGGVGDTRLPMSVKQGDYVVWGPHAGDVYAPDGGHEGDQVILREEDVLAVMDAKFDATAAARGRS